jgi:endonuclease YncB( thermonuclease family)
MSFLGAFLQNVKTRTAAGSANNGQARGTTEYEQYSGYFTGQVRSIIDGDSLYVVGHEEQIRLWGIQAPEKHEAGYNEATQTLRRLAQDQEIEVNVVGIDKFGRTLGRCFFRDGSELNHEMIKSGAAREYTRFTKGYYAKKG